MRNKIPDGYKNLLVYRKADELHREVLKLADEIKRVEREKRDERAVDKILLDLADQMGRASRSPLSNIAEGWKRNTTEEYFTFLGYGVASNDEVKRDCEDIISGKYGKLKGEKGIMGERGITGERGAGIIGEQSKRVAAELSLDQVQKGEGVAAELSLDQVHKLPFYPFNPSNPFVVQIYLRCKELDYLLHQLQQSLEKKIQADGKQSVAKKLKNRKEQENEANQWLEGEIKKIPK